MTPKQEHSGVSFIDRHLATIVMVAVLFAGQVASYAILQSRVNGLEETSKDVIHRSEHQDLTRRTELLELEVVPRSEHLLRDSELNKRLDQIQENIKEVRDRLEVIDARQRGERK